MSCSGWLKKTGATLHPETRQHCFLRQQTGPVSFRRGWKLRTSVCSPVASQSGQARPSCLFPAAIHWAVRAHGNRCPTIRSSLLDLQSPTTGRPTNLTRSVTLTPPSAAQRHCIGPCDVRGVSYSKGSPVLLGMSMLKRCSGFLEDREGIVGLG